MAKRRFALFLLLAVALGSAASTAPKAAADGECSDAPADAVMTLSAPLDKWGRISCTPFGHVLGSHEGWVWSWPDGSGMVFLPSQMVPRDPLPLGSLSYFTKIEVVKVNGSELYDVYNLFRQGLEDNAVKPDGYRVDLTSVSGKTMRVYFFDYDTYAWGMACPDRVCHTDLRFMVVDKAHRPLPRQPSI